MKRRDLENRYKLLFQQLELMNLFNEEFIEKIGKQGYEERIDKILDEILRIKKQLQEMGNKP